MGIRGVEGPEGEKGNRGHNGDDTNCLDVGCPGVKCTAPWVLNGDRTHCYTLTTKVGGAVGNYAKAKLDCATAGGGATLATITSIADNALATSLLTNDGIRTAWIGLNDITTEKTLVWEDGTPFMLDSAMYYQNWYKFKNGGATPFTEPNNGGMVMYDVADAALTTEDCVRLYGAVTGADSNAMATAAYPGLWGDEKCSGSSFDMYPGVCKKIATLLT
jgi:hypothetical protein